MACEDDMDEWDEEDIRNYEKYLESLNETRDDKRSGYI
jgi:hypothetical protein